MAQIDKLEVQTEIKASPDKFYGFLKNNIKGLPNIFPQRITSVELLEGEEGSAGSVQNVKYVIGAPMSAKIKVEEVDDANKSIRYTAIEGDLLQIYKSLMAKVEVNEAGDNGTTHVKWSIEYEKAFEGAPDADPYAELAALISKGLDAYLLLN